MTKKPNSATYAGFLAALEILARDDVAFQKQWRKALRELGLKAAGLASLDFAQLARRLRRRKLKSVEKETAWLVTELAGPGVPLDSAIGAVSAMLEISLPYLMKSAPDLDGPAVAWAQVSMTAVRRIAAIHSAHWEQERERLLASLSEAESRQQGASAYVTRVYERERRRFSQDLHDEIGHDLMLLKLYLEMMTLKLKENDRSDLQSRMEDSLALVAHSIESVRRLILDLGPAIFEDLAFLPAVKSYLRQFASRTGIETSLKEGPWPASVPLSHQIALYRVLQGALSNVMKHSRARHVNITLASLKDIAVRMVVEDDGIGFDTTVTSAVSSFGLTAMSERIELLGGHVLIRSRRSKGSEGSHGTRVEVDIPLTAAPRN